jgi:hypothetical protein
MQRKLSIINVPCRQVKSQDYSLCLRICLCISANVLTHVKSAARAQARILEQAQGVCQEGG